jgi:hypothetical protein
MLLALEDTEVEPVIAPGSFATANNVKPLAALEPHALFAVTLKLPDVVNALLLFFMPIAVPVFDTIVKPIGGVHVYDVALVTELIL